MMLPRLSWHQGRKSDGGARGHAGELEVAHQGGAGGVAPDQAHAGHEGDDREQHAREDRAQLGQVDEGFQTVSLSDSTKRNSFTENVWGGSVVQACVRGET
jgi:hypothetical protein